MNYLKPTHRYHLINLKQIKNILIKVSLIKIIVLYLHM
jgi:hypothetical protein